MTTNELFVFQEEIGQLQKTREALAAELVNLSNQNEGLAKHISNLNKITVDYQVHSPLYIYILRIKLK